MNADQIYSYVQTAAMRDPLVQEKIFNKVMVDAANRFREQSRYQKIFIKQSITPDQQTALNKSFYMFNLDYSASVDTHPHAFARAHRTLSFHLMMFSMRINQGGAMSVAPDGCQAVLKDVGGNPMMHFNATRHNVHTCYPQLDDNDAARQGRFFGTLAQMTEPFDKTHRLMRSRYLARDPRLLCSSKAQFCAVKSPNVMFLHSTYNMTLDDIGRIMDSAGAVSAMGCFIFHPDTLYKQSGYIKDQECHFEKYKRRKVLYIRFFFRNDSQNGYEHRFDTYVALVKAFRVPSRVTDRVYVTQTPYHLNSVLFFELTRTDCAFLPKNRQFRMMPAMAEDHYILYYWKWETLAQRFAVFGQRAFEHMTPVRLVVPKTLFRKIYSYGLSTPEGKFTPKAMTAAALTYNTRTVISGQSVGVPDDPMEPAEVSVLVHAIWMMVYIANWENLQALTAIKEDEERVRTGKFSVWRALFSRRLQRGDMPPIENWGVPADDLKDPNEGGYVTDLIHRMRNVLKGQYRAF